MTPKESATEPHLSGEAEAKEPESPSIEPMEPPESDTNAPSHQRTVRDKVPASLPSKPLLQKQTPAKSFSALGPDPVQKSVADKPTIVAPAAAQPSLPVSMIVRPEGDRETSNLSLFPGELEESFESASAQVKPANSRNRILGRIRELIRWSGAHRRYESVDPQRNVAFDGFRDDMFEEKRERDRRYGTVYTVSEEANAFLVRLELPRRMPESSLKHTWELTDVMPDYACTVTLADGVLTIRGGLLGEARRRLAYVSPSFPSDFQTRIEFPAPVECYKHRLRNKVLEVIVFKSSAINPRSNAGRGNFQD